ncbi:unnamed protein product [Prunus brigantina]
MWTRKPMCPCSCTRTLTCNRLGPKLRGPTVLHYASPTQSAVSIRILTRNLK